jgi:hypothetical protein
MARTFPSLAIMAAPPKDYSEYAVVFQRSLQAVGEEEEENNDDSDIVLYVLIFVLVLVSIFMFLCWRFQHSRYLRGHQVTDIAAHLEERRRALEEKNFVPPEKRKEQLLSSFARNNVTMVRRKSCCIGLLSLHLSLVSVAHCVVCLLTDCPRI